MSGDERVRHCLECNLKVYNFSAMSQDEVVRLLSRSQGRICGRFYRRSDGTVLTQDCPRGLRAIVRRVSRIAGAALSAAMSVGIAAAQNSPQPVSLMQGEVQQQTTGIAVLVLDPQGAVIGHARVRLSNEAGQVVAEGSTNQDGWFTLANLQAQPYFLEVQSQGFQTHKEKVDLKARNIIRIEAKLDLQPLQSVIMTVTSEGIPTSDMSGATQIDVPSLSPVPHQPNLFKRLFTQSGAQTGILIPSENRRKVSPPVRQAGKVSR